MLVMLKVFSRNGSRWVGLLGHWGHQTTCRDGRARGKGRWRSVMYYPCSHCDGTFYPEASSTCVEYLLQPPKYFFWLFDHIVQFSEIVLPYICPLLISKNHLRFHINIETPFFSFSFCTVVLTNRFQFYKPGYKSESLKVKKKKIARSRKDH